jgi:peptidyl-tRNA hydrolase
MRTNWIGARKQKVKQQPAVDLGKQLEAKLAEQKAGIDDIRRRLPKEGFYDPFGVGSAPAKIEPKAEPKAPTKTPVKPLNMSSLKARALTATVPATAKPTRPTARPSNLLVLPGVCGEIQDYYLRTAMRPSAALSVAPAIIVPSTLISGKISGPTGPKGCSAHLYLMAIGATATGKQHVADVAKECLNSIKAGNLIGPNRFKSGPAVIKFIKEHQVSLCVQDEYGPFLAKLSDPRAMTCEREISERLRELYSLQPGAIYNTAEGMSEESIALEGVHLNLLALGVREEFYAACKDIQVVNGLLNRKIIIEEPGMPEENENPSTEALPWKLFENLAKLLSVSKTRLDWDSGTKEIYRELLKSVQQNEDENQRKLYGRDPEKLIRVATTFAAARFSRVGIERSDAELAYKIITASSKFFQQGIEDATAKRILDHQELVREIEKRIASKFEGEATLFQIKQAFRHNKKHKNAVTDAVHDMIDSGTLEEIEVSTGGRPKTILRLVKEGEGSDGNG